MFVFYCYTFVKGLKQINARLVPDIILQIRRYRWCAECNQLILKYFMEYCVNNLYVIYLYTVLQNCLKSSAVLLCFTSNLLVSKVLLKCYIVLQFKIFYTHSVVGVDRLYYMIFSFANFYSTLGSALNIFSPETVENQIG